MLPLIPRQATRYCTGLQLQVMSVIPVGQVTSSYQCRMASPRPLRVTFTVALEKAGRTMFSSASMWAAQWRVHWCLTQQPNQIIAKYSPMSPVFFDKTIQESCDRMSMNCSNQQDREAQAQIISLQFPASYFNKACEYFIEIVLAGVLNLSISFLDCFTVKTLLLFIRIATVKLFLRQPFTYIIF